MVFVSILSKFKIATRLLPQTAYCANLRYSSIGQTRSLFSTPVLPQQKWITVTFVDRDGISSTVKAKVGDTFLDAAVNNDVDLEGFGACEGTLSCSTCHIIFKKEDFDKITEEATDEELDMLDLAFGLTDT